ncbi:MAG: hypothetical protein ABF665_19945, partial [Gluconacetobacter sp.]
GGPAPASRAGGAARPHTSPRCSAPGPRRGARPPPHGTVRPFDGDMADYRVWLSERARAASRPATPAAAPRREDRRDRAEARKAVAPLRRKARDAEARIGKLTAERARLETRLADPALYATGSAEDVTAINTRLAAIGREEAAAEEEWLLAEAAIEEASAQE